MGGDSKIPTILYYDQQGNVCAAGDEANQEGIEQIAGEEEWTKAEWYVTAFMLRTKTHLESRFKLHLRPNTESEAHASDKIRPLPKGKTAIDVFADFLRYLYQCAQKYIEETYFNGPKLWENLQPTSEFVLSHPNGWEGTQQGMMRQAAVTAGLIPDGAAGQARLSFVTEGEASLHFCIQKGLTNEAIKVSNFSSHFQCRMPYVPIRVARASLSLMLVVVLLISVPTSRHRKVVKPLRRLPPHSVHVFPFLILSYFNSGETGFFKGSIFVTSNAKDFLESESTPSCIFQLRSNLNIAHI